MKAVKTLLGTVIIAVVALLMGGCGDKTQYIAKPTTQFFTQDYNPPLLDVLWVLDRRSDLTRKQSMHDSLVSQATKFFKRLDATASTDYRMGFIDMNGDSNHAGIMQPAGSTRNIITKSDGNLNARVAFFSGLIDQIITLTTSAINQGLENARYTLAGNIFYARPKVPLVLVFISDTNDHSTLPTAAGSMSELDYYAQEFLKIKGGNADLLRMYSVNYLNASETCATEYNVDLDTSFGNLATRLSGSSSDLCAPWGDNIDLSGLRLKTLLKSFTLTLVPDPSSIQVVVFDAAGQVTAPAWKYNAATNSIDFDTTPPDGTTIQVSFNSK